MKKTGRILESLSLGTLTGASLAIAITILLAYFSPEKSIIISINQIGEANFELFVIIPLIIFSIIYMMVITRKRYN